MRAKFYSKDGIFEEIKKGSYENGSFYYKNGHFPLSIFEEEKSISFDPNRFSPQEPFGFFKRLETTALYKFDGKNYVQMDIKESTKSNITDYIQTFKISQLQKQQILKKPFELKDLVSIGISILLIVLLVAVYYTTTNAYNLVQRSQLPLNTTMQSMIRLNQILINCFNNASTTSHCYIGAYKPSG